MKTLKAIILFSMLLLGINVTAQEAFLLPEQLITPEIKGAISKATDDVKKGDALVKQADEADSKYEKFLNSSKKRKQAKGERKSVPAKKQRIKAAKFYLSAYSKLDEAYTSVLSGATFSFSEDQDEANELISNADERIAKARTEIEKFTKITDKALETTTYETVKNQMREAQADLDAAVIDKLYAIKLWMAQSDKKLQTEVEETKLWNSARATHTIVAYRDYIAQYPSGKYVTEARGYIKQLEAELLNNNKDDAEKGLLYRVQILADKQQWTIDKVKQKAGYKASQPIDEKFVDGYYKYWVGSFKKYTEANAFKKSLKIRGAFVVCFNDGKQIHVKEAQKLEGKK